MADTSLPSGLLVAGRFAELEEAFVERVHELREGQPLAPLTIVAGSAALCTRLSDLLVRRLGAFANIRVVTLARLAADLAAAGNGGAPLRLAGRLVRERLVRQVVQTQREAGSLRHFADVSQLPHFAQALTSTFDDLRQGCVASDDAWTVWAGGKAAVKGADLKRLFAAYCAALADRGLIDDAGLYRAAAATVTGVAAGAGGGARVMLYGIYDLNEAQEALLTGLLAAGADAFVPTLGEHGDEATPLRRAALAAGGAIVAPPGGDGRDRDLDHLAGALRRGRAMSSEELEFHGDGSLAIVSVPDEHYEAREAVREVLTAAGAPAGAGHDAPTAIALAAPFSDCAVVVPRADDVEQLAARFVAAGVPVACRRPQRESGAQALLLLLDCIAPVAGREFARRSVVDLLVLAASDGEGAPAVSQTALWAAEARSAGIVAGEEQWRDRLLRRRLETERISGRLERDDAADEDDGVAERLRRARLRLEAATSLEAAVGLLLDACAGLPQRAGWAAWAESLAAVAAKAFPAPIAPGAADAARRLAALDVLAEEVDVRQMAAVLREQLAQATVRAGRVGREGVAILTPLELRGLRFHTVVVTGLAEGGLPTRGRPDPILGDGERAATAEALGIRLPLSEEREAESSRLFLLAVEAARERLTLLAPRSDSATGRPRQPSRFLLRIAALASGHAVAADELWRGEAPLAPPVWRRLAGRVAEGFSPGRIWIDARERDTAALLALAAAPSAASVSYLGHVLDESDAGRGGDEAGRRLAQWRAGRREDCGPHDGVLGADACDWFATTGPFAAEVSPTSLERYIACPFTYLLRSVLSLEPPDEPDEGLEIEARRFGTLAHDILEDVYAQVIAHDLGLTGALGALEPAWARACATAESRGVTGAALAWRTRRAALLDDLREVLQRDPVFASGDGRPLRVECPFGETRDVPVGVDLADGRRVRFSGRIDRIDRTSLGIRVIDYKTGKGESEEKRLKKGLSVQLPAYALAARHLAEREGAADEIKCAYRLVTRRGGFRDVDVVYRGNQAEEALGRLLERLTALTARGLFPRTAESGACDYCDVRYACGFSQWARKRKRSGADLADVVALQQGEAEACASDAAEDAGGLPSRHEAARV